MSVSRYYLAVYGVCVCVGVGGGGAVGGVRGCSLPVTLCYCGVYMYMCVADGSGFVWDYVVREFFLNIITDFIKKKIDRF